MPKPESEKIPVTLVTGFLGSGKTTLLNHILKLKGSRRVAVVENEVGEINIDNNLVMENLLSKEDLVSMDRGCVCCSLRHDIVNALKELESRATSRNLQYDNILLETTGLADPAPVAFTFFSNAHISAHYRLDSILCLVDAQHVVQHLEDARGGDVNEAVNQIAFADLILLNKIDLVSPDQLEKARKLVRSINVTADLIEVALRTEQPEQLPGWERLMGINSFSIERALLVDPNFMDSDSSDNESDGCDVAAAEEDLQDVPSEEANNGNNTVEENGEENAKRKLAENGHDATTTTTDGVPSSDSPHRPKNPRKRRKKLHDVSNVCAVGITARGPLDKYRFNCFMRDLLSERARDVFRSKGVLCVKGQEQTKFVFQGVHETICFGPAAYGWRPDEQPVNQIVFIGRGLKRKDLLEGFRSCVWVPLPDGWSEHKDVKTGRPYYVHAETKEKRWDRPTEVACALVKASETSHRQPRALQPRKSVDE